MVVQTVAYSTTAHFYTFQITNFIIPKQFTSVITVEFAYNNRVANSKEEYIELLKQQYLEQHDIELEDHEITQIEEIKNV